MRYALMTAALMVAGCASAAFAHDYKAGPLVVDHPWSRATPRGASVAGGYLRITNTGTTPDRLIGGTAEGAKRFEIHEMSMTDGVMRMRELKDGVEIPAGATIELKPGSYHVMMMDLSKQLTKGDRVKASLTFEKAGKVDIEFVVEAIGGPPAGDDAKSREHKH